MKFPKPTKRPVSVMRAFDTLELHACLQTADLVEQDDTLKEPSMFSVYGHLKNPGGVECLEDFAEHAKALAWMKKEAKRCSLEFEDYWEHGGKEKSPPAEPESDGFCIFSETWMDGRVPTVSDEDGYVIFPTELEAQREIADAQLTRIQEFLDGERDFDDAMAVGEFIVPVTVHKDRIATEFGDFPRRP